MPSLLKNKTFVLLAGIVLVFCIEAADYLTGPELAFSFFYLLAIFYFAHFFGFWAGIAASLFLAAASVATDILTNARYSHASVPIWTFCIRLANFSIASVIFSLLEKRSRALKELNMELKESNENLQAFTSMASHDLKTPLAVIGMYSTLLRQTEPNLGEEGKKHLETIEKTNTRMMRLITDLLEYSRLSHKDIPFEKVDLSALFERLLADLSGLIREKRASVIMDNLPAIQGNTALLRQLFQNLITNALKYCERAPEIRVTAELRENKALIRISDNGIGFDNGRREEIFAPFQRLHSGYEGTGMGLAICRRIAEQHGGTISAESREGEGSIFTVTLPLAH